MIGHTLRTDLTRHVGYTPTYHFLNDALLDQNIDFMMLSGRVRTSGERLNCSIHSSLLSLFGLLLDPLTTPDQQESILNNNPVSFIQEFNNIHNSHLTVAEFMQWVASHQSPQGLDQGIIQMLAPCVRSIIFGMHQRNAVTTEDIALRAYGFGDQYMGMLEEGVFSYLYLIFGVPIVIRTTLPQYQQIDSTYHNIRLFEIPETEQQDAFLLVHQNARRDHFEAMGYMTNSGVEENRCRYVSANSMLDQQNSPYQVAHSKLLNKLNQVECEDFAKLFIQSDINQFFRCEKCQYFGMGHGFSRLSYNWRDSKLVDKLSEMDNLQRLSDMVNIRMVKRFAPELDDIDCDILARYIRHKLQSKEQIDAFIQTMHTTCMEKYQVLVDILIALTIIGLVYVLIVNICDHKRSFSCVSGHDEVINVISHITDTIHPF